MIVNDLDVVRAVFTPDEAHTPLENRDQSKVASDSLYDPTPVSKPHFSLAEALSRSTPRTDQDRSPGLSPNWTTLALACLAELPYIDGSRSYATMLFGARADTKPRKGLYFFSCQIRKDIIMDRHAIFLDAGYSEKAIGSTHTTMMEPGQRS